MHNAVPVSSGNLVANDSMVGPGIYYAVYKYSGCYSSPSPFKLVKADCSSGMTDLYASIDSTKKPAGTIVKFHTAKPVSSSNIYSGNAHAVPSGTYYVSYYDAVKDCYTMASPIRVIPNMVCGTNPDINTTHINVAVSGNVHTNDNVPVGSAYGTPVANAGNPSATLPVMNANGTYTFTPPNVGVYVFNVPVCSADTALGCVTETLTITVTNPYINNNPPIVNPDIASVDSGGTVNVPVLVNDNPGNTGGSLGTPTLPTPPGHGTTTVNPDGTIHYTPNPGFTVVDTFVYNVCDTSANPDLCKSTTVTVNVNPGGTSDNTILANDDFDKIPMNTVATGNVKTNDIDPDGDPMKVTAQNITIPGAGTFVLDTLGNYTFTPNPGFYGPVQIPYTVCDNMSHCQNATLHMLVDPVNTLNPDFNVTNINVLVNGNMSNNDQLVPGSSFGTPVANTGNPTTAVPTMNANGTYTFTPTLPGVYVFNVPVCPPGVSVSCPIETLTITATNPYVNNNPPVVNPDIASVDSGGNVNIPVLVNDQPGNPGGSLGTPVSSDPPHGTTSTNPDGTIHYTPDPGFEGVDTFTYTVCDTAATPDLCKTTTVTVHVNPPGSASNTIIANDDHANILMNTVASGNVKTNDIDPDGDPMTVTAQNITIPGTGTFVLNASGNYVFTPNPGFFGTVQIPYSICDNMSHCQTAVLHVVVNPVNSLNPDFNVTNINVTANGNMSSNDNLVSGSSFGTPTAGTGNPSTDVPTMNANGTYTFNTDTAGVYTFNVPVCPPGVSISCPIETLTITVNNPGINTNPPVVNPDVATVDSGSSLNIPVLVNDAPGNPGGSLGTPTVTDSPHGTVTVNPDGTVHYTPDPGFTGVDTFTYTVCDTSMNPDKCGTTTVTVHVNPPSLQNTTLGADDYAYTFGTVPVSGNVLTNDIDPEGQNQTVTAQSITNANGTFVLNNNGTYTFTPASGFTGSLSFPYQVCDEGTPTACATATLHVLVDKAPDYTPSIFGASTLFTNSDTVRNFVAAIYNVNNTINKGRVKFRMSQSLPNKVFIVDPVMTTIDYNGSPVAVGNNDWDIVLNGIFYEFTLKANVVFPPNGVMYVGFKVKVQQAAPVNQIQPITATIIFQSGGDINFSNNNYTITVTKN